MNSSIQLQSQEFDLQLYLQVLCKKQHTDDEEQERQRLQIDFISLEKDLHRVQGIQERTCQQIVEFVDQHRDRFIQINDQLDLIEDKVKRSEVILKLLSSQIDEYKASCYLNESRIQKYITDYEMKLMEQQILESARSEGVFLLKFNSSFQNITCRQIGSLNLTQKYLISRFTYKLEYLLSLFNHQIVKDFIPETFQILDIINNMAEEFEFYLSEQLAKYQQIIISAKSEQERQVILQVLNQIKIWYININKQEQYYKVLQKNTIQKEMQNGEKILLANKTSLLSGKDQPILQTVFYKIFAALKQFPQNYPRDRLKNLIFAFFRKEELKFLYTYAMPIFPLAYTSYMQALEAGGVQEWLKSQLKECHGWNLKMWIMVREKNILDRSNNDTDMLKWVEIIFKQACILPGTISEFLKLTFKLVNRYLDKITKGQFSPSSFNRLVEQKEKVGATVAAKIIENTKDEQYGMKVQRCFNNSFENAIRELLNKSLHNVAVTCQNFLEPVKSFVSKIIKKDKQFVQNNTVNKSQNLFKPLHAFIRNNSDLTPQALEFITNSVESLVVKHYDSKYATEIFAYSKDQLIPEQVSQVMEVVGRQRTSLFKQKQQR